MNDATVYKMLACVIEQERDDCLHPILPKGTAPDTEAHVISDLVKLVQ